MCRQKRLKLKFSIKKSNAELTKKLLKQLSDSTKEEIKLWRKNEPSPRGAES